MSFKFALEDFELDVLENRGNGRLLVYDPATGKTEMLLDGLYFANGVALSADEDYILVNETSRYQITKYWLKGEKAGTSEIFADNLPGMPDGLARAENGDFLVAFYSKRSGMIDFLQRFPKLKNLLLTCHKAYSRSLLHTALSESWMPTLTSSSLSTIQKVL